MNFKNLKKTLEIFLFFVLVVLLLNNSASAQVIDIWSGTSGGGCNATGPCNFCDALIVVKNIIDFLFKIVIPLSVLMIVYGGIRLMIAGGSEQNVKKGRAIIVSALIGLTIALSAWLIVSTVLQFLSGNASFPWSSITCA